MGFDDDLRALDDEMTAFATKMATHRGSMTADAEGLVTLRWRARSRALLAKHEGACRCVEAQARIDAALAECARLREVADENNAAANACRGTSEMRRRASYADEARTLRHAADHIERALKGGDDG